MIVDLDTSPLPEFFPCDVIVVGSGAAGLTLATQLAARGMSVAVLEAGGAAFDQTEQQNFRAGSISPDNHGPVHMYRRRAFGGTTAIWGGRCIPFDPIDFEAREEIPGSGWPIPYDDVARYYPKALDTLDAGPALFNAAHALPQSPKPLVENAGSGEIVLDRLERFSRPTNLGAKFHDDIAASKSILLLLHANCTEILTGEIGGKATGVGVAAPGGRRFTLNARAVVLAAGALEIPRLLLNSRSVRAAGLGNEHDLVGRFYMAHIEGSAGGLKFRVPGSKVKLDYEVSPQGIYCRRLIKLSPEAQRAHRTMNIILRPYHDNIVDPAHGDAVLSAMFIVKDMIVQEYARSMTFTERRIREKYAGHSAQFWMRHFGNVILGSPGLAGFGVDWIHRRVLASRKLPSVVRLRRDNNYPLEFNSEQAPNRDSRVMLASQTDPFGTPRLAIDWRYTERDRKSIVDSFALLRAGFAAGNSASLVYDDCELAEKIAGCTRVGGHHIGTARMGGTPAEGVVDANCEVWSTKNLFVCGAATFPTSGAANPTLTIVAMAHRLADHLAPRLRGQS